MPRLSTYVWALWISAVLTSWAFAQEICEYDDIVIERVNGIINAGCEDYDTIPKPKTLTVSEIDMAITCERSKLDAISILQELPHQDDICTESIQDALRGIHRIINLLQVHREKAPEDFVENNL